MSTRILSTNILRTAALTAILLTNRALAHGPVIPVNIGIDPLTGQQQLVTNQIDFSPIMQTSKTNGGSNAYIIGTPARSFPSSYYLPAYNYISATTYPDGSGPKTAYTPPADTTAIPMVLFTAASGDTTNTGWYGQLEATDGNGTSTPQTGPGFTSGFVGANTIMRLTFANTLLYWNGAAFTSTPNGELLQAIASSKAGTSTYANTLTSPTASQLGGGSTGTQLGNGVTIVSSAAPGAGDHTQLTYRLMDSAGVSTDASNDLTPGLYLATFQIGTDTTSLNANHAPSPNQYETSLPFYYLYDFNPNNDPSITAQEAAAASYINTVLVPEPSCIALAMGSLALLGRRRGRSI